MSGVKTAADRQPMHRALDHSVRVTSDLSAPVHPLVLAGGASSRMGSDKALLSYFETPHVRHAAALVERVAPPVYVSVRESQVAEEALRGLRLLCDPVANIGPTRAARSMSRGSCPRWSAPGGSSAIASWS